MMLSQFPEHSTIGDKISSDTLLTEDTSKDTFIVFKEK